MCSKSSACQSGYSSVFGSNNSSSGQLGTANETITCNTSPQVYAAGELSCAVVNPTLAALYPGPAALNIIRTLNASRALAPNLTSYGGDGAIHAELFYQGEEQFFCKADGCTVQSNTSLASSWSNWTCTNLQCICRPGTTMCGANKVRDVSPLSMNTVIRLN